MDEYEVILLDRALADLNGIYTYIERTLLSPDTAYSLAERIDQAILSLRQMPYRFPILLRGFYADRGYRYMLVKKYTVIYRVDESAKEVIVVAVHHASSNF